MPRQRKRREKKEVIMELKKLAMFSWKYFSSAIYNYCKEIF